MHLGKLLTNLIIIAFLLVGTIGVGYSGMIMGHGVDSMIGCPLLGHDAAVCGMNPLEHLSVWQNMFAAIPMQSTGVLILLLLALFSVLHFDEHRRLFYPSPQLVYIRPDPEVATHDSFRRFIARGLMHPKIF